MKAMPGGSLRLTLPRSAHSRGMPGPPDARETDEESRIGRAATHWLPHLMFRAAMIFATMPPGPFQLLLSVSNPWQ